MQRKQMELLMLANPNMMGGMGGMGGGYDPMMGGMGGFDPMGGYGGGQGGMPF